MNKLLLTAILMLGFASQQTLADTVTAPTFTTKDAAGNDVSLPSRKDGVDIYLFWATWCPYCKALMPHLQSIQVEYGDNVRVYALQIRDDEDPVVFMEDNGYDFVLLPHADDVMDLYGVRSTPALFLVDQQGLLQFNLSEMMFDASAEFNTLGNRQKSVRVAPYWAAAIRTGIDKILGEQSSD